MEELILKQVGENKDKVIKIIRDVTGLGLQQTKDLVDRVAAGQEYTLSGLSKDSVAAVAAELEAVGANVGVRSVPADSLSEQKEGITVYRSRSKNTCPSCGRLFKTGDIFCEGCGAQVGNGMLPVASAVQTNHQSTGRFTVYKIFAVLAAAVVIVLVIRGMNSQDWEIELVKNSMFNKYDYGISIGDALNNWFHGTEEWDCYTMQEVTYVVAEGTTNYSFFDKPENQRFVFQIIDDEHFLFDGAYDINGNLINTENSNIYADVALDFMNLLLSLQDESIYEYTLRGAFGDQEVLKIFSDETESIGTDGNPVSEPREMKQSTDAARTKQKTEDLDLSLYLSDSPEEIIASAGLAMMPEQGEIMFYKGYDGGLSITSEDEYASKEVSVSLSRGDIGMTLWGIKPGMDMEETVQELKNQGHKIYYYKGMADNYFCFMADYQCLCLVGDGQGAIDIVQYNRSPLKELDFGPNGSREVWEGTYQDWEDMCIDLVEYETGSRENANVVFWAGDGSPGSKGILGEAKWQKEYENVVTYMGGTDKITLCFLWNGMIKAEVQSEHANLSGINSTLFKVEEVG